MNLHDLAVRISEKEAGEQEVNIAQIKEILAVLPSIYREYVRSGTVGDVPYKIKQFIRMITGDEKLLPYIEFNIKKPDTFFDGSDFSIQLYGKYDDYR